MRNLAQGFAFNAKELMANMNMKRLTFLGKDCMPYTHDCHKDEFSANVFLTHFFLVINDIIERNVTFHLISTSKYTACLKSRIVQGYRFRQLYKAGFFEGLDPIKTYFKGAEIVFSIYCLRKPRFQTIYLNDIMQEKLVQKLIEGKQYGDGKIDTTWQDYMQEMYNKYANIPKKDLNYIVRTGWINFFQLKVRGADISLLQRPAKAYIGNLFKDPLKHFQYYKEKMLFKMIFLDRKKNKLKLDNKWYIYLSKQDIEQLEKGEMIHKKTGFRLREMADLKNGRKTYIYSVPYKEGDPKYIKYFSQENFKDMTFEGRRKATTFKYIQDNLKKFKV